MDPSVLPAFVGVAVLVCLAPGPDMVYVIATGVAGGRLAAVRAALGIAVGVLTYAIAAAAGIGRVLHDGPALLVLIQAAGAAYLAWLGLTTLRDAGGAQTAAQHDDDRPLRPWFRRGLVVNLTNPKVLLFFVALLPQFLGHATEQTLQLLVLGVTFGTVGLLVDLAVGLTSGTVRDRVLNDPRLHITLGRVSGLVYVVLAVVVAADLFSTAVR